MIENYLQNRIKLIANSNLEFIKIKCTDNIKIFEITSPKTPT